MALLLLIQLRMHCFSEIEVSKPTSQGYVLMSKLWSLARHLGLLQKVLNPVSNSQGRALELSFCHLSVVIVMLSRMMYIVHVEYATSDDNLDLALGQAVLTFRPYMLLPYITRFAVRGEQISPN